MAHPIVIEGFRYKDLPPLNPRKVPIEADLSRHDVHVLHELCRGKTVVEFGTGGSTLLLARFARVVVSYEHDKEWINFVHRAAVRRRKAGTRMCRIILEHVPDCMPPRSVPRVGVAFIDGRRDHRHFWVEFALRRKIAPVIVLHDSRAEKSPIAACQSLLTWPLTLRIDRVAYHYKNSNHLVVWMRDRPALYENWNRIEKSGRLPHLHKQ
jgi:hypothetical protein